MGVYFADIGSNDISKLNDLPADDLPIDAAQLQLKYGDRQTVMFTYR
jgi:hypothetical protein